MAALGLSANAIVALVVLISKVHSQDCLQNTPVYGDQGGGMEIQILENDNVYLIPNYTFSCHGNVTQWKACVESGGGGEKYTIIFSVLRPGSELPNCYSLVDYNTLSLDAAPTNSCVTLDVPVNQVSISVQPGDVVGVLPMSVNTNNNNGIEIDVNVTGVTAWYAPVNNFMVADRSPCAYRILDGNLSLSISVAPVITAVVAPSPSPAPTASTFTASPSRTPPNISLPATSTPRTSPPSTSSPSSPPPGSSSPPPGSSSFPNTAAIIGLVVAGVAAIVVVVLVVVILVILCGIRGHCRRETVPLDNSSDKHVTIRGIQNPNYDERKEFTTAITTTTTNSHSTSVYEMVDRPSVGTLNSDSEHPPPVDRFSLRNAHQASPPKPPPKKPGAEKTYAAVGPRTPLAPPTPLVLPPSTDTDYTYFTLESNPSGSAYSDPTVPTLLNSGSIYSDPTEPTPQNPDSIYSDPTVPPGPARQNSGTVPLPVYHVLESGGYHELERGSGQELGWAGSRGHTYHELEAGDLPNGESFYDDPTLPKFRNDIYSDKTASLLSAGIYVPTFEQRQESGGHYETTEMNKTGGYNRLKFFVVDQTYWAPASTTSGLYEQLATKKYREIPRPHMKLGKELGSGNFGDVRCGVWMFSGVTMDVAVKTLKPSAPESEKVKFLQEAAIMGQFSHRNVVKLFGVVTVGEPSMIVLELLPNGDLRTYLNQSLQIDRAQNQLPLQRQFLKFSQEIVAGMLHLSTKSFVHRDLAARNILLDQTMTCKVADFGLARDLTDDTYYTTRGGKIPVKWTAPEALLYKRYSVASDVYSFAMVLFEIWSVGSKPFPGISNSDAISLAGRGCIQAPPPGCPRAIYHLMVQCWNPIHEHRPTFSDIVNYLNGNSDSLLKLDTAAPKNARLLGSGLSEGQALHDDLQTRYHQ